MHQCRRPPEGCTQRVGVPEAAEFGAGLSDPHSRIPHWDFQTTSGGRAHAGTRSEHSPTRLLRHVQQWRVTAASPTPDCPHPTSAQPYHRLPDKLQHHPSLASAQSKPLSSCITDHVFLSRYFQSASHPVWQLFERIADRPELGGIPIPRVDHGSPRQSHPRGLTKRSLYPQCPARRWQ